MKYRFDLHHRVFAWLLYPIVVLIQLLLCGCASAQTPSVYAPRARVTRIQADAAHFLDSLVTYSQAVRQEAVACITAYHLKDDTLVITRFSPAGNIKKADSLSIHVFPHKTFCPDGTATVHTHIVEETLEMPSPVDLNTAITHRQWGMIVEAKPSFGGYYYLIFYP